MKTQSLVLAGLICTMISPSLRARDDHPLINIGADTEYSSGRQGPGFVFRVEGAVSSKPTSELGLVIGYFSSEMTFDGTEKGTDLTSFNIDLIPFYLTTGRGFPNKDYGGFALFPMEMSKNSVLDEGFTYKVSLVGIMMEEGLRSAYETDSSSNRLVLKLMASAIGYKIQKSVEESRGEFKGMSVADFNSEVALLLSKEHQIEVAAGLSGDFNLGQQSNMGFAVQSDYGAYLKLSGLVLENLQAYVQAGVRGNLNTKIDDRNEAYVRAGVSYFFRK